jgi:hypothetical protein
MEKSLNWIKILIDHSLTHWLELRKSTGIPWQHHIVVPEAKMAKDICKITNDLLSKRNCPIAPNRVLSAEYAISEEGEKDKPREKIRRDIAITHLETLKCDVILSYKVLGRSADFPLLATALNLRKFKDTTRDSHTQVILSDIL